MGFVPPKADVIPNSPGEERYIITCCLNHPEIIIDLAEQLKPEDFFNEFYRYSFQVCVKLVEKEMVPEPMTVFNNLDKIGVAKPGYLRELELISRASHDTQNVAEAVSGIKATSTRRQLIDAAYASIESLQKDNLSPDEAIQLSEERVLEVATRLSSSTEVYLIGSAAEEEVRKRAENPVVVPGLPTGFHKFDEELQGLQAGRLYVLAARYKVGKSIWLLNVAYNVANVAKVPVLFIDTENSSHQVDDRFISLVSGVDEVEIRNGMFALRPEKSEKVFDAINQLKDIEIYHHYMPNFTFEACISVIRRYRAQKNIGLVVFDYIKTPDDITFRDVREDQTIGYLTSNFHNKVAGALDIPVLSACQLGRRGDNEDANDSHIADSDRIGRYADVVIVLREKTDDEKAAFGANKHQGNMTMGIQVNRAGPAKQQVYDLWFEKPKMKMEEKRVRGV
jgi:replicative DNA helicase